MLTLLKWFTSAVQNKPAPTEMSWDSELLMQMQEHSIRSNQFAKFQYLNQDQGFGHWI